MALLHTDIINTPVIDFENLPIMLKLNFQFRTKVQPHHIQYEVQGFLVAAKYNHVIHVSEVIERNTEFIHHYRAQTFFYPMVEWRKVQVCEILTCKAANHQTFFLTVTVYYRINQHKQPFVGYRKPYD